MFLYDIEVLRPRYERSQVELFSWLQAQHRYKKNTIAVKFLERLKEGGFPIESRGFEFPEFLEDDPEKLDLFNPMKNPHGPTLGKRTLLFQEYALQKFREFYKNTNTPPEQIFHVTCTGYHSPSAAQILVSEKNWGKQTPVTHLYHMGCYASIPAIRLALGGKSQQIDIVHTELCSLHMDSELTSLEQLVVQSLFSDGYVKYSISSKDADSTKKYYFEILSTFEEIVPHSIPYMSWFPTEWSFQMELSKSVPQMISKEIKTFTDTLIKRAGFSSAEIFSKENVAFAIHPGGARIIDEVKQALELSEFQVQHSREVLQKFGNMSSATLPTIWSEISLDSNIKDGTLVLSFAFGPGLTICGALFRLRKNK